LPHNPKVISSVEKLEREFAAQFGFAGSFATGFGRGALLRALNASDVRGGEVLLPDFVCEQVTAAALRAGGKPVFFPVQKDLSVLPESFRAAFTPATRAAVVVHYFGRALHSMGALAAICRENGVPLIEDCALALGAPEAGQHGDFAVFSFTKSDWCYGGGMLAARSQERIERARAVRQAAFRSTPGLAFLYGLLRRADYVANRPTFARAADFAGRTLETFSGHREMGFYDAGQCDSHLPGFAARRAGQLLEELPACIDQRRRITETIYESLGFARRILLRPEPDSRDSFAFLLLLSETGQAIAWREQASQVGVTLRLCWPAYQQAVPAQTNATLGWLAEHLLFLEIHPNLSEREVQRIVRCLKNLAG
jgi:dTDP-4-amino-4,6-dideoxygalactose transaminase